MADSLNALLESEQKHMERVYSTFEHKVEDADKNVKKSRAYVRSDAFEDQDAFIHHNALSRARKEKNEAAGLYESLYEKPYFAHVEIKYDGDDASEHYYLSDNEHLNKMQSVEGDGYLIPFKQDPLRPMLSAMFHCYQMKKPEDVRYKTPDGKEEVFKPLFMCDDTIRNRTLLSVVQLISNQVDDAVDADELLESILEENRNDPALRNIIATLQQKQFEIIETEVRKSFVVQGCAGSGKSQCLFHRLFYLRDTLSADGWEHVLLITPTQLFRNYSADMVRRYNLQSIQDCSISELYLELLNTYDSRFSKRQYHFVLSEEYLPGGYIKEVYNARTLGYVSDAIERAISEQMVRACSLLSIPVPEDRSPSTIDGIAEMIDLRIEEEEKNKSASKAGKKEKSLLDKLKSMKAGFSRIESFLFDQIAWKTVLPLKEKYGVQTQMIEEQADERKRGKRVLHKSDLLFYLMIYVRLHGIEGLPSYRLLCIDEGQDLNKADYDMLKTIFPDAAFNVFGDTNQILYADYDVEDWKEKTGIDTLFTLEKNYRNNAAIVEFCNQMFGCGMQYIGKADKYQYPKVIKDKYDAIKTLQEENLAVIVKDKNEFEWLRSVVGEFADLEFFDTYADSVSQEKIPCYSIYAAKGLEFQKVLVFPYEMTLNQKVVACTRATQSLYYCEI